MPLDPIKDSNTLDNGLLGHPHTHASLVAKLDTWWFLICCLVVRQGRRVCSWLCSAPWLSPRRRCRSMAWSALAITSPSRLIEASQRMLTST